MAQTGFTPISIYHSGTTTNVPTNTNLAAGELAINFADGILFYKDDANVVQKIAYKLTPIAAGGTGATTAQAAINALVGGVTAGQIVQGNGTNIVLAAAPTWNQNTTGNAATATTATTATTQAPADSSTKIATTAYVDNAVLGQQFKEAAKYATTAALPTVVYANGSSGVGATLTGFAVGALAIDSASPSVADRILVKNQASSLQNGIYVVTATGSGIAVFVMTRATDFDMPTDIKTGATIYIVSGTANPATTWTYNAADAPTIGTDALTFAQAAGIGSLTSGNGITITGASVAIDTGVTVDKTTAQTLTNKTLTSPTLTTPALGTPASGTLTNATGLPPGGVVGTAAILGANTFTAAQTQSTAASQNLSRVTVASHATTGDIWSAGHQIDWTGTATTTIFPNAPQAGAERVLICAGACSFTAGANMLVDGVASGATVTCAANDQVIVRAVSTTQFKLSRVKYDGTPQVSSGASGLVCLAVASASNSATINFTSLIDATYPEYEIHFQNVIPASDGVDISLRTSSDGGSTFAATSGDYGFTQTGTNDALTPIVGGSRTVTGITLSSAITGVSNTASYGGLSGKVVLIKPSGTASNKHFIFETQTANSTTTGAAIGSGVRFNTAAINAVRFICSSGNITSGTFQLFGVRGSV